MCYLKCSIKYLIKEAFTSLQLTEVLSPTLLHPPEPVEMNNTEQQELGYMPLRDDFEKVIITEFTVPFYQIIQNAQPPEITFFTAASDVI